MSAETTTNICHDIHIATDDTPPQEIIDYFEAGLGSRIFDPTRSDTASADLAELRRGWQAAGDTVVFTSGVFDLMHQNHRAYLGHVKRSAAPLHYGRLHGGNDAPPWEALDAGQRSRFFLDSVQQDAIKLIVSVDGNDSVARRKGFNPSKGGAARPIFDWQTRARDILGASFESPTGNLVRLVDAVTIHDEVDPRLTDGPHRAIMEIGSFVNPDVWAVFCESEDIVAAARQEYAQRLGAVSLVLLEGHEFFGDELLGGNFKTTAITRRILGAAALTERPVAGEPA